MHSYTLHPTPCNLTLTMHPKTLNPKTCTINPQAPNPEHAWEVARSVLVEEARPKSPVGWYCERDNLGRYMYGVRADVLPHLVFRLWGTCLGSRSVGFGGRGQTEVAQLCLVQGSGVSGLFERSPQTVTSKVSTGASKSLYQARPRTVAFSKKVLVEEARQKSPSFAWLIDSGLVPREQKMLKGHLPRVICHQVY